MLDEAIEYLKQLQLQVQVSNFLLSPQSSVVSSTSFLFCSCWFRKFIISLLSPTQTLGLCSQSSAKVAQQYSEVIFVSLAFSSSTEPTLCCSGDYCF